MLCSYQLCDHSTALDYGARALEVAREENDDSLAARALGPARAHPHRKRGELEEALEAATGAVEHARAAGDSGLLTRALGIEGAILANMGRESLPVFTEALSVSRRAGDRMHSAGLLNNIGVTELAAGASTAARDHLHEALELAREFQDAYAIATSLHNLGLAAYLGGDHVHARRSFSEALELARRTAQPSGFTYSLVGFTLVRARTGEVDEAARLHGAVDALSDQLAEQFDSFELTLGGRRVSTARVARRGPLPGHLPGWPRPVARPGNRTRPVDQHNRTLALPSVAEAVRRVQVAVRPRLLRRPVSRPALAATSRGSARPHRGPQPGRRVSRP